MYKGFKTPIDVKILGPNFQELISTAKKILGERIQEAVHDHPQVRRQFWGA